MGWASNSVLLLGIALSILMIVALVYVPFLAGLFDNVMFPPVLWPVLAVFALILYSIESLRKSGLRLYETRRNARMTNGH